MSLLAKMLETNTAHSGVKVLSAKVAQIWDITISHQNLVGKGSEAFKIGLVWVVTQAGSRTCLVMWLATYLNSWVVCTGSFVINAILSCLNLLSNSAIYLGAWNSGPKSTWRIASFEISTRHPLTLTSVNLGCKIALLLLGRSHWIVAAYDA